MLHNHEINPRKKNNNDENKMHNLPTTFSLPVTKMRAHYNSMHILSFEDSRGLTG